MAGTADAGASDQAQPSVHVHGGQGVQAGTGNQQINNFVGDGGTQIIYSYNSLTWTDGVAPPPLADVWGFIESPYRGLAAFEERDAPFYFGRDTAATAVLDRMSRCVNGPGLMVVSGVSGAGKSSLLRAGVLPRMRGAGLAGVPGSAFWPCLVFTPGGAPLDELAVQVATLARIDANTVRSAVAADPSGFALTARQAVLAQLTQPGAEPPGRAEHSRRLLIVVDQFEQLFTRCTDERQRQAFITALRAATASGRWPEQAGAALVVLGVRADFEARCASYPELADPVQDRYLLTAMTERQLRMAITEPAKNARSRVDPDLVGVLLQEVRARQPTASAGVLPLLSHALDQAWRSRTGHEISLADYDRTGGIEGAVASSAQRAYDGLTSAQQARARQVFTRLTATSSDGVDTAARVSRTELTAGKSPAQAGDAEAVLEAFAAERLLTLAADTVEISHEVLLTAWPLLRDVWLAETHTDRIIRTKLLSAASEWANHQQDSSYLYAGTVLEAARQTAARIDSDPARHPPLRQDERAFLQASDSAQHRRARRRRILVVVLVAMVIGLATAAVLVFLAQKNAVHQRDTAISDEVASRSEAIGDSNPRLAKLLSIAAWRISPTADARFAMLKEAALPGIAVLSGHTGPVNAIAFSPDSKILASGSDDHTVRLWDVADGKPIGKPLPSTTGRVKSVAFSPDGKLLAVSTENSTLQLWDVATRTPLGAPYDSHTGPMNSVAFSPDGKLLASGSENGTVQLWDVATRTPVGRPLVSHARALYSVAFSPDGKTLASGSQIGTVQLWDVATRAPIGRPLPGDYASVLSVSFSPDGKTLVVGDNSGRIRLWDVATRRPISRRRYSHTGPVHSVAFNPDGETLAIGGQDDTVRLWDVVKRLPIGQPFTGHTDWVNSVAFSPDGTVLASGSRDNTIRLWRMPVKQPIPHTGRADSAQFSRDGKTLTVGRNNGAAQFWNVATRKPIGKPVGSHTSLSNASALSSDSRTFASVDANWTIRTWDTTTGREIGTPIRTGRVNSVALSPDGTILASAEDDGTARLWDVGTSKPIGKPLSGHSRFMLVVAFSPDGATLASGGQKIQLWDVATGRPIGDALPSQTQIVNSVTFSPDGKTLAAVVDGDTTIQLWDVATRQPIGQPIVTHTDLVGSVTFSPDSKLLVGSSRTVQVWDVATRQLIGQLFPAHISGVGPLAFSPDGKTLALGGSNIVLWNISYLADPMKYLCEASAGSLTPAEWTRWIPPGPAYQTTCP